jgi:hypothetical protein
MQSSAAYQIKVSSRYPHIAARIRDIVASSAHNESSLSDHEYDLYECSDDVAFISVNKHDLLQTTMEYEVIDGAYSHLKLLEALQGFPDTSVRVLEEKVW